MFHRLCNQSIGIHIRFVIAIGVFIEGNGHVLAVLCICLGFVSNFRFQCPPRYHQTVNVIDQRVTRGTLEPDIAEKAKADAKNCKDMAIAFNEYANSDYKADMDADTLIAAAMKK